MTLTLGNTYVYTVVTHSQISCGCFVSVGKLFEMKKSNLPLIQATTMRSNPHSIFRHLCKCGVLLVSLFSLTLALNAQSSGTGIVQGRVLNESSGLYLNNARVSVKGTALETFTNANGDYVLANVPAGEVELAVSFVGLASKSISITVEAGATNIQDFGLRIQSMREGEVVELEPFTIEAQTMSASSVAITEQRNAPNIKNVISMDEFVDMADGNIGEFLKFIPGVDIQYNPFFAGAISLRGMPSSGTLVQFDGVPTAPGAGVTRQFDLNTAASANIDRIEVSKVPTPDMPANAVGGSVNVISRTGFIRKDALFSYNVYLTHSYMEGEWGKFNPTISKQPGVDARSAKRRSDIGYDLSYILPLNQKVGFTFAVTRAPRYNPAEFHQPSYNQNTGIINTAYYANYLSYVDLKTYKATMDVKVGDYGTFQLSYHDTDRYSFVRQNRFGFSFGSGGEGNTFVSREGAAGAVGSANQLLTYNSQYRTLSLGSIKFKHDGPVWKMEAHASHSKGGFKYSDMEDGFFNTGSTNITNLRVNGYGFDGVESQRIPYFEAFRRTTNEQIDPFDGNLYSINSVTSNESDVTNKVDSLGANISREFDFTIPTRIKVGVYSETMRRRNEAGASTYTFTPPGGAAGKLASVHNVIANEYSDIASFTNVRGQEVDLRIISLGELYKLYQQNPSWFVLNESAAYVNRVNGTTKLKETVTAGFIRMDNKFMNNRLSITSGVRYEKTVDDGAGPLNDIGATYQRDANGNFIRDSQGKLVKITTNALDNARLQYTRLGFKKKTNYDGFYPSLNASYSFTDRMILRAGYARTIVRPELNQIIPSVNVTDPAVDSVTGTIRIVDGDLQPWEANNYDLTFEVYDIKGATASLSLFAKDVKGFFATTRTQATPDVLAELQLPADPYSDYDIIRTTNTGDATVSGWEISYRQSLKDIIPGVGRYFDVFGNMTNLAIRGDGGENFPEFSPRNINAGISFTRKNLVLKLNANYHKWVRRSVAAASSTTPAGSFNFRAPSTKWDFSGEYRFWRELSLFLSVRNLTAEPVRLQAYAPGTPEYSRPRNYQYVAAHASFGIKGKF